MASRSVTRDAFAGFLNQSTSPSLETDNTDSFIFAGWFKLPTGAGADTAPPGFNNRTLLMKGALNAGCSYGFKSRGTGVTSALAFYAKKNPSFPQIIESSVPLSDNVAYFVVGWVDIVAGTINIKIDANPVESDPLAFSSFVDDGGPLQVFMEPGFSDYFAFLIVDEWFFCKNPVDMGIAVARIDTHIYLGGTGIQYASLDASSKTIIGLVSWWGFDETTMPKLDLHGPNPFTFDYALDSATANAAPLVASFLTLDLFESLTPADATSDVWDAEKTLPDSELLLDTLTIVLPDQILFIGENTSLFDDISHVIQAVFSESVFLADAFATAPILTALQDSFRLSAWLSLKLNPPVSHWTD